ncbi:MAG: mechanosensitive ion channel, partial [Acidobacteriota bacterium]|nr:mechanosensitive ion channel [Acidobacteriota bacterium]
KAAPSKAAPATSAPSTPSPSKSAAAASITAPADELIQYLNQSINLYHQTAIQQQIAGQPQEQLLLYDNRQLATQSVQLAFQFARAQLDIMSAQSAAAQSATSGSQQYDSLRKMLAGLEKNLQDTQAEQDDDTRKLATLTGAKRAQLQSTIAELQGEIALAQARRDAVRSMMEFLGSSANTGVSTSGLRAQIDALASSVPAAAAGTASGPAHPAEPFALSDGQPAPSNLWDLFADLFGLSSKLHTVNSMITDTSALLATSDNLRAPFVAQLRDLSKQGDALAAEADTADRSQLAQERQQLDSIAAQFRQLATAVIPLSKQRVLLDLYAKNLSNWRDVIYSRYKSDARGLAYRLGALAILFAVVWLLSEIWRRAVYRYVHEPRRRHQFLLIRKLAFWFVIAVIVVLTFASKLGSFVTFAGLLTAGLAVALQNVLVSMVGYFFLIGKFGIRVGDRIEVNGVSGEVIEIGLLRFYVMELGAGATTTGRVVAFPNSIVFQPTAGLFKQIPGAAFAWHQVTLTVPRDADFGLIKKSLLGSVENVLRDYHADIETVYHHIEKTGIVMSDRGLRPRLELHLTPSGIDATIRYPVDLQHASDIDARVSREILTVLERDAKLQTPEGPAIRLRTDVAAGAPSK